MKIKFLEFHVIFLIHTNCLLPIGCHFWRPTISFCSCHHTQFTALHFEQFYALFGVFPVATLQSAFQLHVVHQQCPQWSLCSGHLSLNPEECASWNEDDRPSVNAVYCGLLWSFLDMPHSSDDNNKGSNSSTYALTCVWKVIADIQYRSNVY